MFNYNLDFNLKKAWCKKTHSQIYVVTVCSELLSHVTGLYYKEDKEPKTLYLGSDFFENHTPRSFFLTIDPEKARNFTAYSQEYVNKFLPLLLADSKTTITPEVAQVSTWENRGFGLTIMVPLLGVQHRFLQAWYTQPYKWSLDKKDAAIYETFGQALRVLQGKEPRIYAQDQLALN